MMSNLFFTLIVTILLIGCTTQQQEETQGEVTNTNSSNVPSTKESILLSDSSLNFRDSMIVARAMLDSLRLMHQNQKRAAYEALQEREKQVADSLFQIEKALFDDFYAVYQLNDKVVGIVVNKMEGRGYFWREPAFDLFYRDTLPSQTLEERKKESFYAHTVFPMFKNTAVTVNYNSLLNQPFYVYSTEGRSKTFVKNVLFVSEECIPGSFIFLELEMSNIKGRGLYATTQKYELEYGDYEEASIKYNVHQKPWRECDFEEDSKYLKILAKYKGYYLGYREEMDYEDDTRIIPYRKIFDFGECANKKYCEMQFFKTLKYSAIDMYGCPCD